MAVATEKGLSKRADMNEVMEEMTRIMREVKSGRANLDVVGKQTGVCNTLLKGMLLELHYKMFETRQLTPDGIRQLE